MLKYVDDFRSIETTQWMWGAYHALGNLLHDLSVNELVEKAVLPSGELGFLGTWINLDDRTISVTFQWMVQDWVHK